MPKYQDPNFDKEAYWKKRCSEPAVQRMGRQLDRGSAIVAVHNSGPDWPRKPVSKKARLKDSKRARKVQHA